jgi:hypothetical protein
MDWLIWTGAVISLVGVAGLLWCIVLAMQTRRGGLAEDVLRAKLQKVVFLNVGALGISALGLMLVVMGILLG